MTTTSLSYNYLQFVRFKDLSLWDVKKNRIFENRESSNYDFVSLADVLTQVKRIEILQPNKEYNLLGVRSYGLGIFHRETKKGNDIKSKYLWELQEGDLVYSRLGASSGSFGLISKEFNNYFVSNEFPAFSIDTNRVIPEYLNLVLTSKHFYEKIAVFNTGSALKRFHEDKFLNLEIPIPSLINQRKIISEQNGFAERLINLKSDITELNNKIQKYFLDKLGIIKNENQKNISSSKILFVRYKNIQKWSLSSILKEKLFSFKNVNHSIILLSKIVISFDGGKTPSTSRKDYWNGNINWISPKDFNGIEINDSIDKITEKAVKECGMKIYEKGVLLGVFRSGILRHSFPVAITNLPVAVNQDIKAMLVDSKIINSKYLLYFLHLLQEYVLENCVKYGVTVESLNTDEFLSLKIIVPNLKTQFEIVKNLDQLFDKVVLKNNEITKIEIKKRKSLETSIFN